MLYVPATTTDMAVHLLCLALTIITFGLGLFVWIPIILADSRSERNLIIRVVDGRISLKVVKV